MKEFGMKFSMQNVFFPRKKGFMKKRYIQFEVALRTDVRSFRGSIFRIQGASQGGKRNLRKDRVCRLSCPPLLHGRGDLSHRD